MASKARGLADLGNAFNDGALSNRNLIINGAMQVAQRGTSFTNSANVNFYTLDRWFMNNSSETITTTQQINTEADAATTGQRYFMRNVVSTSGNFAGIAQKIENVFQFNGKTFTLSFWARGGAAGGNIPTTFRVYANGLSGGTIIDADILPTTNITLTSNWQYYTVSFTTPSLSFSSYTTDESNTCFHLFFQQTTAETCDFDLTGVSLEVGDTATPFEHRSYGQELALCQRYFQKNNGYFYRSGTVSSTSTGNQEAIPFMVQMRAEPSMLIGSAGLINIATGYPIVGAVWTTQFSIWVAVNTSGSHFRYAINYWADAEL